MKKIPLLALLLAFTAVSVMPGYAFAKDSNDDDDDIRIELRGGWHDDDEDDDDNDDKDSNKSLEIEADVYTDMTIVKVELEEEGRKTVFSTTADTKAEVVDVVAAKFNLSKSEVEAALDFEIEDRASRSKERAKLSFTNNRPVKPAKPVEVCDNSTSSTLEVEADVFTNTTIVKVEKGDTKTVFETSATTTDDIAAAVVARISGVTTSEVKAVLDIDIEDRASKASDLIISSNNDDDDCDNVATTTKDKNTKVEARLEARIAELQKLIEKLMLLLTLRLGN